MADEIPVPAAEPLAAPAAPAPAPAAPLNIDKICVVIGRTRHRMMQAEIQEAAKRGAKFIELRLDFLARAPDFRRLLADKPCTLLATVRRPVDGGRFSGTEEERLTLLRQAIVSGFDWVDLETDVIDKIRRFKDVKRIVSYHNLREMPADLEKIYEKMCGQDADIVKLAVVAHDPSDNLRLLDLLRTAPKPTVALCTGDMGLPSRILSLSLGAPFTFAAFNKERGVTPGMPSFDDMQNLYCADRLHAQTALYGVIGDPIAHSLSPLIHNKALRHLGLDAVYLPFRVPRSALQVFLKNFDRLPVKAYSVTIPHKEMACTLANVREAEVIDIQAANTLLRVESGWAAHNTDATAFIQSLEANLPPPEEGMPPWTLQGRSVLILGAGGVGRAVAHAVKPRVAQLTIANRTPEKAHALAAQLNCRTADWEARHSIAADLVINCTSIGMHPNTDESPLHASYFKPGLMVFDTVYTPETTLLVKEARARGCHVLTGVDMFVRQAALQCALFTGREAPLEFIREVIRRALSPVVLRDDEKVPEA
jgi:3-dehydroquinate dehydratase/shikimate dehydrogenase